MDPFQVLEKLQTTVGRKKTLRTCGKAEQGTHKQSPLLSRRGTEWVIGLEGLGTASWAAHRLLPEEPRLRGTLKKPDKPCLARRLPRNQDSS